MVMMVAVVMVRLVLGPYVLAFSIPSLLFRIPSFIVRGRKIKARNEASVQQVEGGQQEGGKQNMKSEQVVPM